MVPNKTSHLALLFKEIHQGNKSAFDDFFLLYYDKLLAFALQYTKQLESAEEITSELFVKIWIKRNGLLAILNPEVYLFIAVKNACLNLIRAEKKRITVLSSPSEEYQINEIPDSDHSELEDKELKKILDTAVNGLPDQRKIIFKLIKEDGLKGHEVASILGISVRTVESQLYKAVKALAESISNYIGYHPQKKISKKQPLSGLSILFFL